MQICDTTTTQDYLKLLVKTIETLLNELRDHRYKCPSDQVNWARVRVISVSYTTEYFDFEYEPYEYMVLKIGSASHDSDNVKNIIEKYLKRKGLINVQVEVKTER